MDDGRSKWDDYRHDFGPLNADIARWKRSKKIVAWFHVFQAVVAAGIVVCIYLLMDGAR